jgi:hypothetical protein
LQPISQIDQTSGYIKKNIVASEIQRMVGSMVASRKKQYDEEIQRRG